MRERFIVLAKAKISEAREAVISKTDEGRITVAQRMVVKEGNRELGMYMRESMHVKDIDSLISFRNALNVAIDSLK